MDIERTEETQKMGITKVLKHLGRGDLTTEAEAGRREQRGIESGRVEKMREMIIRLSDDKTGPSTIELLFNAMEEKRRNGTLANSIERRFFNDILATTRAQFYGWSPENGFEVVSFNPDKHYSFDKMRPGDQCRVVVVGCTSGTENIKPALVKQIQS